MWWIYLQTLKVLFLSWFILVWVNVFDKELSTAHQAQFHNISFQKLTFLFESVIILYPLYFVTVLNAKYGSQQTYHVLVSINGTDKLPFWSNLASFVALLNICQALFSIVQHWFIILASRPNPLCWVSFVELYWLADKCLQ